MFMFILSFSTTKCCECLIKDVCLEYKVKVATWPPYLFITLLWTIFNTMILSAQSDRNSESLQDRNTSCHSTLSVNSATYLPYLIIMEFFCTFFYFMKLFQYQQTFLKICKYVWLHNTYKHILLTYTYLYSGYHPHCKIVLCFIDTRFTT